MAADGHSLSSFGRRSGPNAPGVAFVTGGARGLGNAMYLVKAWIPLDAHSKD